MPRKRHINQRGGLIDAPGAYLLACTGRSFRQTGGFQLETEPMLRQLEYEAWDGKPCPNCTPSALANALAYYRRRWPQIPDDPRERYRLLRGHLRLVHSPLPGSGGYPAFLNAVLVRRLWRLLGIDAWPVTYPFPSARRLRQLIASDGTPLVLSIWSKAYLGHTVLLLGWEIWSDGQAPRLFWVVHDGWSDAPRFLDAEAVRIWQAVRMAR